MRALIRGGCVAITAAALVASMAGVAAAKPKKQSTAKYAKTVCGAYSKIDAQLTSFGNALGAIDSTDPAAFQAQAVTAANAFVASVKTASTKLTDAYPDVSDGKKVAALVNSQPDTIQSAISTALTQLQAETGPAAVAAPAQFTAAVLALSARLKADDPLTRVQDQDVINAIQKEKSCKNVISVTGG
jgi:hypothetical protein